MWDFGLEEAKLGIRASMKEYAEWYYGGDSEIKANKAKSRKIWLKNRNLYFFS